MNSGCGKVPASMRDAGTITQDHPWTDRRSICAGVLVLPFEVEHIEQVPDRGHVVLVTSREPYDGVFRELAGEGEEAGPPLRIRRIGDCRQPALIAHACSRATRPRGSWIIRSHRGRESAQFTHRMCI
jgi:hypothetical protein